MHSHTVSEISESTSSSSVSSVASFSELCSAPPFYMAQNWMMRPWHGAVMVQFAALLLDIPCMFLFAIVVFTGYRASLLCSLLEQQGLTGAGCSSSAKTHVSLRHVVQPHVLILEQCSELLRDLGCIVLAVPIVLAGRRHILMTELASCSSASIFESTGNRQLTAIQQRSALLRARRSLIIRCFQEYFRRGDPLYPVFPTRCILPSIL